MFDMLVCTALFHLYLIALCTKPQQEKMLIIYCIISESEGLMGGLSGSGSWCSYMKTFYRYFDSMLNAKKCSIA